MKYIAYCRKSIDEKDKQVLSIDQQIASLASLNSFVANIIPLQDE